MDLSGYVTMLMESLEKKVRLLDGIIDENLRQKEILEDPQATPEQLSSTIDLKSDYINELNELDEGFEELYNRIEKELRANKIRYKAQIVRMQECIRLITEKSSRIRLQEDENNRLATSKFSYVKEQLQTMNKTAHVANVYQKNMIGAGFDSQFMDNKK